MKLSKAQLKALILISECTRRTLNANTTCSLENKGLITRDYKSEIPQELTNKGYLYLYNYYQIDSEQS